MSEHDQAVAVAIPDDELDMNQCALDVWDKLREVAEQAIVPLAPIPGDVFMVLREMLDRGYIEIGPNLRG